MGKIKKTKDGWSISYADNYDAIGTLNQRLGTLRHKLANRDKTILDKRNEMIKLNYKVAELNRKVNSLVYPYEIENEIRQLEHWVKEFEQAIEEEKKDGV